MKFSHFPDSFITYTDDAITANYTFEEIKKAHLNAPEVTEDELNVSLQILSKEPSETVYRGKFHWSIFGYILSYLIEDSHKKEDSKIIQNKVKFTVSKKDSRKFFEEIYPFATSPICLEEYFQKIAA